MIDFEEDKNMKEVKRVKAKDFDSEAFKRKEFRIIIRSPKSLLRTLKFLHENGFKWGLSKTSLLDDDNMRKSLMERVQDRHVVIAAGGIICNGVLHNLLALPDAQTVELIFEEEANDKIVITNDGKTTTATLYSNGKKAGIGTAVCHDDDKFDIYAGAKLALERLEKNKKEAEMTDWEKFVKGKVDMRVPKKYLQNFLDRADKDMLKFAGSMEDWYLKWLKEDGDSILIGKMASNVCGHLLTQVIRYDNGVEVLYFPGMK